MSAVCGKKRGGQGLVHIVGEKGLTEVVPPARLGKQVAPGAFVRYIVDSCLSNEYKGSRLFSP